MSFLRLLLLLSLCYILAGCNSMTSIPEQIGTSTLLTGSVNLGEMNFSEKLSDIEKSGIQVNLMSKNTFINSTVPISAIVSGESNEYSLGTMADWKIALKTPCTSEEATITGVFTTGFEEKNPVLLKEYCTMLSMTENQDLVTKLFERFDSGAIVRDISGDEFDPSRVQSNSEINPSTPRTPLEKLVTILGVEHKNAVVRFSALRQYKDSLLILTAGAQEPGLPGYNIARIYKRGDSLYLQYYGQGTTIDIYRLDSIYGTGFTQELMISAYNILTDTEKRFDSNTERLLIGDFITQPSIINRRIEEKIRQEFFTL